jgi:hypothetical protein
MMQSRNWARITFRIFKHLRPRTRKAPSLIKLHRRCMTRGRVPTRKDSGRTTAAAATFGASVHYKPTNSSFAVPHYYSRVRAISLVTRVLTALKISSESWARDSPTKTCTREQRNRCSQFHSERTDLLFQGADAYLSSTGVICRRFESALSLVTEQMSFRRSPLEFRVSMKELNPRSHHEVKHSKLLSRLFIYSLFSFTMHILILRLFSRVRSHSPF